MTVWTSHVLSAKTLHHQSKLPKVKNFGEPSKKNTSLTLAPYPANLSNTAQLLGKHVAISMQICLAKSEDSDYKGSPGDVAACLQFSRIVSRSVALMKSRSQKSLQAWEGGEVPHRPALLTP